MADNCDVLVDFSDLSDLCPLMPTPLLTTGILIQWMRRHFSEETRITIPILKEYLWTDAIEDTAIVIDSVYKFNAAQTEARPGIFIKRGAWKVIRLGIDDRKMLRMNDGCNPQQYVTFYQGSHTVFCVGGEAAEVELLATEVYRELIMAGPRARKLFNFLRFVVTDIGELALLEEATENFVVPIVVAYGGQDVWEICNTPPV